MPNLSLTPIDVDVAIEGVSIGSSVFVTRISVTNVVNDFPSATVSLGYKTPAGKEALQKIFPRAGSEGSYYREITIKVSGGETDLTSVPGSVTLFKGVVVGFSHTKSAGQIDYEIVAKGGPFLLSGLPAVVPGVHAESSGAWYLFSSDAIGGEENNTRQAFMTSLKNAFKSGDLVTGIKAFAEEVTRLYSKEKAGDPSNAESARIALKTFAFGDITATQVKKELGKIESIGIDKPVFFGKADVSGLPGLEAQPSILNFSDNLIHSVAETVIGIFSNNHRLTWWDFIMLIFETFAVDVISVGEKLLAIPKTVLLSLSENSRINVFLPADEVQVSMRDAPLFSPTRVVLTCPPLAADERTNTTDIVPSLKGTTGVIYPKNSHAPTSQEESTGVKVLVLDTPPWFYGLQQNINNSVGIDRNELLTKVSASHRSWTTLDNSPDAPLKKGSSDQQKAIDSICTAFAAYVFYKERFKARAGSLVGRFKPEVIPGMPARVIDAADIATFDCWIVSVTHVLDYGAASAITSCEYGYGRYGGEQPDLLNAMYPLFEISTVEKAIEKELGSALKFFDQLTASGGGKQ